MMEKRKTSGSGNGATKKKRKVDHTKQTKSVSKTQRTQNTEQKKLNSSHSSKQSNGKHDSGSKKVAKNFWWHSKKVNKPERDGHVGSEKVSKGESASKLVRSRSEKGEVKISKKKALQLKKKWQRKNRLLRKKKNLGEDSTGEVLRDPKTWGKSKKLGKGTREGKKAARRDMKSQIGKECEGSKMKKLGEDRRTSEEAVTCKDSNQGVAKSAIGAQGSSQSPSLQKSGMQKKHKRKKVKQFTKVRNAKESAQAIRTPTDNDSDASAPEQEGSNNLKGEKKSLKEKDVKTEMGPSSKAEVSSNWKALLPIVKKSKDAVAKRHRKYGKGGKRNEHPKPSKPDIWFDNVDPSLIKANENAESDDDDVQSETGCNPLIRKDAQDCLTKCLAMDCEMVGIGPKGSQSILARVSVVNQFGACVLDKYVTPREPVTDYRTFVSGIRPQDLGEKGEDFEKVQKELSDILKGRVLVGHALHNDFKVLYFNHPRSLIRDTSSYLPFKELFKSKRPGLKKLTELVLKVKVQKGEHNSVEDAQAAMKLYMLHRREWEKSFREKTRHQRSKKKPSKVAKKTASEALN